MLRQKAGGYGMVLLAHSLMKSGLLRVVSCIGCVNVQKVFKIMKRPPQPIVLVPKVSPSEKFKKYFDARGWSERA